MLSRSASSQYTEEPRHTQSRQVGRPGPGGGRDTGHPPVSLRDPDLCLGECPGHLCPLGDCHGVPPAKGSAAPSLALGHDRREADPPSVTTQAVIGPRRVLRAREGVWGHPLVSPPWVSSLVSQSPAEREQSQKEVWLPDARGNPGGEDAASPESFLGLTVPAPQPSPGKQPPAVPSPRPGVMRCGPRPPNSDWL